MTGVQTCALPIFFLSFEQSQRSTKLNRRMSTHITDCIAKLGNLFGRWFSSAGNEGESVDVLGFVVLGLSKTFFSGKEIVNLGFSPVVGGLCTPFAVFRTSAGLGVDDGTHVELVRSTRDGNLMRGGIKRLAVSHVG